MSSSERPPLLLNPSELIEHSDREFGSMVHDVRELAATVKSKDVAWMTYLFETQQRELYRWTTLAINYANMNHEMSSELQEQAITIARLEAQRRQNILGPWIIGLAVVALGTLFSENIPKEIPVVLLALIVFLVVFLLYDRSPKKKADR